ncbi:cell wall hydrolase [Caulobacter soli]|uniref:cell wall hydrolase n=1 Tax=Caulobacter soli TaxID=2708539 RepID=UPI001FE50FFC|nr:cell wall hydrolase [Caulobacter soli]
MYDLGRLRPLVDTASARDAITRVTLAEAAGQGDSGLAGVVYTILNRLASGAWGDSVDQVVNARGQFEPVLRAGGDWRALPPAGPAQRARIDTIVNLALDGRLPDLTGGALYFQNPRIVAARAAAGAVSPGLVHFGGAAPSAVIGDHAFYAQVAGRGAPAPADVLARAGGAIFVRKAGSSDGAAEAAPGRAAGDRGLFVLPDGAIVEERPRRLGGTASAGSPFRGSTPPSGGD